MQEVQIEEILKHLENEVGAKAREIAILKATVLANEKTINELKKENQEIKSDL
jgi:hypothetical protein